MLQCMVLMGSLFLSDGQVMVDFGSVTGVERQGDLLLVVSGGRETRLDASRYPQSVAVDEIVADCAPKAQTPVLGLEIADARG